MSDINPPLPDQGPTDGIHGEEGEAPISIDESVDNRPEDPDPTDEPDGPDPAVTDDGVLSPGSTADGSPTALD